MYNKYVFFEKEIPFEQMEKLGMDRKKLLSAPRQILEPLLNGEITPLLASRIKASNGKEVIIPLKMQLRRGKNGEVDVITYPVRNQITSDVRLNFKEIEKLEKGEVIKKNVNEKGRHILKFLQLDEETKCVMIRNAANIRVQDKLRNIESINDIQIGLTQKQAAVEGKPVELTIGDKKVSFGVDLKEPQGFKVLHGDLEEWEKQKKIKYDLENEGFMGYVMTDENRWQYQKVVDRLEGKHNKLEQKKENGLKI